MAERVTSWIGGDWYWDALGKEWVSVAADEAKLREPAERPAEGTSRERHGKRVREIWVAWANEQPDAKPSWLVPWEDLDDAQREVDMRIGAGLWGDGFADGMDNMGAVQRALTVPAEGTEDVEALGIIRTAMVDAAASERLGVANNEVLDAIAETARLAIVALIQRREREAVEQAAHRYEDEANAVGFRAGYEAGKRATLKAWGHQG